MGAAPSRDHAELAISSRLMAAHIADFYNEITPRHASGHLLDLGCGKQPLFGLYEAHVSQITAADWPSSFHDNAHLDVFCDLTKPLPFRDGSFDTVLLSDVLEHLPEAGLAFQEVFRILRPGGHLLLNTPFLYPVHEAPHDYLRHTRYSLQRHSELVGFEVIELRAIGGVVDVLIDTVSKALASVPVVGRVFAATLQGVAIHLRHSALARLLRIRSENHFPLAHGLVVRRPSA